MDFITFYGSSDQSLVKRPFEGPGLPSIHHISIKEVFFSVSQSLHGRQSSAAADISTALLA